MIIKNFTITDPVKNMFPFYNLTSTQFFNFVGSNEFTCAPDYSNSMSLISFLPQVNFKKCTVCSSTVHEKCFKLKNKNNFVIKTKKLYSLE